jgi:hypothetical protein
MRFSRLRLPRCGAFSFDRGTLANTRHWLCAACWRLERSTGLPEPLPYFSATARRAFTSRGRFTWAISWRYPIVGRGWAFVCRRRDCNTDSLTARSFQLWHFPSMRWAIGMSLDARELYSSPNGDRWYLARDPGSGQVFVMHEPNAPSGGRTTCIEIGDFLHRGSHGPEHRELLRLIGTLVESTPQI